MLRYLFLGILYTYSGCRCNYAWVSASHTGRYARLTSLGLYVMYVLLRALCPGQVSADHTLVSDPNTTVPITRRLFSSLAKTPRLEPAAWNRVDPLVLRSGRNCRIGRRQSGTHDGKPLCSFKPYDKLRRSRLECW